MKTTSYKMRLSASILPIFVTFFTVSAYSQSRCETLFAKPSVYGTSFALLKELNNTTEDLIEILKTKPQELDGATLDAKVAELGILAEKYFQENSIAFEKMGATTMVKNLKDFSQYGLFYPIYRISGGINGDGISRLMYGVQSNPKNKDNPLKIIFDPLYQINYTDSNGHFNPRSKTLFIGSHVISQEIAGLSSTLRHEIQHYFGQIKVLNGEMALARLSFWEVNPVEKTPYGEFLNMDEVETHLRDLRTLLNVGLMDSKDAKLISIISKPENIALFKKTRPLLAKELYQRLLGLIKNSRAAMNNFETAGVTSTTISKDNGGIDVRYELMSPPYSGGAISLLGLLKPEELKDSQKVKLKIKEILQWNETRLVEIENELKFLASKLPVE